MPYASPEFLNKLDSHRGWYHQRKLPHYDAANKYQSITYRLADSVPEEALLHILIQVFPGNRLGKIVQSWKSFTGRRIVDRRAAPTGHSNARARARHSQDNTPKSVWMREYWDRFIRDDRHFYSSIHYIHNNPVKAKLVTESEQWPWSSAKLNKSYAYE